VAFVRISHSAAVRGVLAEGCRRKLLEEARDELRSHVEEVVALSRQGVSYDGPVEDLVRGSIFTSMAEQVAKRLLKTI